MQLAHQEYTVKNRVGLLQEFTAQEERQSVPLHSLETRAIGEQDFVGVGASCLDEKAATLVFVVCLCLFFGWNCPFYHQSFLDVYFL